MSVNVRKDGGVVIELRGRRILVDPRGLPQQRPHVVFISHSHRDHYNLRALRVLRDVPKVMSQATWDLIDPAHKLENVVTVTAGDSVEVAGIQLEVHEAGHVIGSLQLRVEGCVVYTGDFNLERRVVLRPAPLLKADTLVIDATYGHPRYSFPPRMQLYRAVVKLVTEAISEGRGIAIAARALGTAQEVTALLSLTAKIPPFVIADIAEKNKVYERYGEFLGDYVAYSFEAPQRSVRVVPLESSEREAVPCTGWALDGARGIPLSSHADFNDLIKYVSESGACEVYAFSTFSQNLANFASRTLSVSAKPV